MIKVGEMDTDQPLEDGLLQMLVNVEAEHHEEGWGYPPVLGLIYRTLLSPELLREQLGEDFDVPLEKMVGAFAFEAKKMFDFGDPNFAYYGEDPVTAMTLMTATLKVAEEKPAPENLQCWFLVAEAMLHQRKRFRRLVRHARIVVAVDLTDTPYGVVRYKDTGEVHAEFGNVEGDGGVIDALRDLLQASIA